MSEAQFLGYLVISLTSLIGLFVVVGKPIMNSVKIMTELNSSISEIKADVIKLSSNLEKQTEHAREGRKKLWNAHDDLENKVGDHEKRINTLETKVSIHHEKL